MVVGKMGLLHVGGYRIPTLLLIELLGKAKPQGSRAFVDS